MGRGLGADGGRPGGGRALGRLTPPPSAERLPAARVVFTLALPLLRALVLAAAAAYLAIYVWIAFSRARYPFDLEWMEGAMVEHVRRWVAGKPVYAAPSLEFSPFIYGPGYYVVAGLFTKLLGVDYFALRVASIAASFGSFVLTFELVRRETSSKAAGLVATGLFAASYALSGYWFDLARVDSLFVALCLLAVALVRGARRPRHCALAGAALFAAFVTKQPALLLLPALAGYLYVYRRPLTRWLVVPVVLLVGVEVGLASWFSKGWYWFYTVRLPFGQGWVPTADLWKSETLGPLAFALCFSCLYFFGGAAREQRAFYGAVLAALFGIAVLSRAHLGSYMNDDMTAHLAAALGAGLGAAPFVSSTRRAARGRALFALGLLLLQFALLFSDPRRGIPAPSDWGAAKRFLARVRALPGSVYVGAHGNVAAQVGKPSFFHAMALFDLGHSPSAEAIAKPFLAEFERAIAAQRFGAIITDGADFNFPSPEQLELRYYPAEQHVIPRPGVLYPRSGLRSRPEILYLPRPASSQ